MIFIRIAQQNFVLFELIQVGLLKKLFVILLLWYIVLLGRYRSIDW